MEKEYLFHRSYMGYPKLCLSDEQAIEEAIRDGEVVRVDDERGEQVWPADKVNLLYKKMVKKYPGKL